MAGENSLKYAVLVVLLQLCSQVVSLPPRDGVTRKGIILKMYTQEECREFEKDPVTVEGIVYKRSGKQRDKEVENGAYLALVQRYVHLTNPANSFDFVVITSLKGYQDNTFVAGAKLLPLKSDADLDDAIILMEDPPGLEFVLVDKKCSFIKTGEPAVSMTYQCGDDNYNNYM